MTKAKASAKKPTAKRPVYFKVLRDGRSWHGGDWEWSLPTPDGKGGYTPGEWHDAGEPVLCSGGFHLTDKPGLWWGEGAEAFVVEYAGRTDGSSDGNKIAVERCRLLRPATHEELAATGLYLSGVHNAYDSATVHAYDSATVRAYGSATVRAYGSATVRAYDSATVRAYDSATVRAYGSATVHAYDSATVHAYGSATVHAYDSATVHAYGSATVIATVYAVATAVYELNNRAVLVDRRNGKPTCTVAK